jgi:hypothetical protein
VAPEKSRAPRHETALPIERRGLHPRGRLIASGARYGSDCCTHSAAACAATR